jgi:hypothetical protein
MPLLTARARGQDEFMKQPDRVHTQTDAPDATLTAVADPPPQAIAELVRVVTAARSASLST